MRGYLPASEVSCFLCDALAELKEVRTNANRSKGSQVRNKSRLDNGEEQIEIQKRTYAHVTLTMNRSINSRYMYISYIYIRKKFSSR